MKDFVEFVVKRLVDNPDEVRVNSIDGETTTVIELHVAQPDMGKVLGKQGKNVRALRQLLTAAAAKRGKRATLEVLE